MNRTREWVLHSLVIGLCLALAGLLIYLAYFGAWSK